MFTEDTIVIALPGIGNDTEARRTRHAKIYRDILGREVEVKHYQYDQYMDELKARWSFKVGRTALVLALASVGVSIGGPAVGAGVSAIAKAAIKAQEEYILDVLGYLYFDSSIRQRILQDLADILESIPASKKVILSGHSMGSIIIADLLTHRPELHVDVCALLGSPLGMKNNCYHGLADIAGLWIERRLGPPEFGTETYNVYSQTDILAGPINHPGVINIPILGSHRNLKKHLANAKVKISQNHPM